MDKPFELNPGELAAVPLELITPDPDQPRKDFDEDYIKELASSIKASGVIQPIVLRKDPDQPGRFIIIAGENRYRASKLAKLKTIDAVLREEQGLNLLLVQLKENCQRKDLNPMEWAKALQVMNKTHGLKQADIEKTLKESGVGQFGRAYISNTIRLLELPQWAQDLIKENHITAAHGKYMLPALASDKVTADLAAKFAMTEGLKKSDYQPSTRDLQRDIFYMFHKHHKNLDNWETSFDYKELCVKSGCQKMRKYSWENGTGTFCLDQACWSEKAAEYDQQQEALRETERQAEEEAPPKDIVVDENNCVDIDQGELDLSDYRPFSYANFDLSVCSGCEHNHQPKGENLGRIVNGDECACFNLPCFFAKQRQHVDAKICVNHFLIEQIQDHIKQSPKECLQLMAWIAALCPSGVEEHDNIDDEYVIYNTVYVNEDDEDLDKALFKNNLLSARQFLKADELQFVDLAAYMVSRIEDELIIDLVQHYKIDIDAYRIDKRYLEGFSDDQLMAWLNTFVWDEEQLTHLTDAETTDREALEHFATYYAEQIGVPADIRFAYTLAMTPKEEE